MYRFNSYPSKGGLNNLLASLANYIIVCFLIFSIFIKLDAQYDFEFGTVESPLRSVSEVVGDTKISVIYSSPSIGEQEIWGEFVPEEEVWVAGANKATIIEFTNDVIINNTQINYGKYSLFMIPHAGQNTWTIILNDDHDQEGTEDYDSSKDILRFDVNSEGIDPSERLIYDIEYQDSRTGRIALRWVNEKIFFDVTTFLEDVINNQLSDLLSNAQNYNKWVFYLNAAEALFNTNENINKALEWINKSEQYSTDPMEWNYTEYTQAYVLGHMMWVKAKILAATGDINGAIAYTEQLIALEDNSFYFLNNAEEGINDQLGNWSGT